MGATSRRVGQQGSGCHPGLCTFSALPRYPNGAAAGNFAADHLGARFWAAPALTTKFTRFGSAVDTTNRLFKDWTKVFPDPLNAQVIAERLTERAEVFLMDGKKYRDPRNHETA